MSAAEDSIEKKKLTKDDFSFHEELGEGSFAKVRQ